MITVRGPFICVNAYWSGNWKPVHISMSREVCINSFGPNDSLYYQLVKKRGPDWKEEKKNNATLPLVLYVVVIVIIFCLSGSLLSYFILLTHYCRSISFNFKSDRLTIHNFAIWRFMSFHFDSWSSLCSLITLQGCPMLSVSVRRKEI